MREMFVIKNGKKLRCGYTTGTCSAAAAAGAALLLLKGEEPRTLRAKLPSGKAAELAPAGCGLREGRAFCSVIKDGGDDPDVTNGIKITAFVSKRKDGIIRVFGGAGIGTVTQDGLKCPKGGSAINPVPLKMISQSVRETAEKCGYAGGLDVELEAENGERIAQKTFNPRLGIVGGISILGTTGIVEPMSERAVIETIKTEIEKYGAENRQAILFNAGNYGKAFCREKMGLDLARGVKISNYFGEAIDHALYCGFKEILIISHIGKISKLAAGVMNTHSSVADARAEVFAAHAALSGANKETVREIMQALTTAQMIEILKKAGLEKETLLSVGESILQKIGARTKGAARCEIVVFDNEEHTVFISGGAVELAEKISF
ncbi:cobalt-precorrin-5B (C(1))-methyltransferase CbiD [Christensenella tenuis]|uniref:Cobalt-precorrin-5B C(1)-methyltransferase n=1 Tax=Christensenella tenuis TaxID=2763033 RepID=A0ABR7EJ74_9FIRM|nr:cobalt-precorrin-5B (C(1))-methyltransferase CbiD [Christensenella tenuis]MBC5649189.1 cobalamin biosynthesis protein CbiD [Christensenella tenuis]